MWLLDAMLEGTIPGAWVLRFVSKPDVPVKFLSEQLSFCYEGATYYLFGIGIRGLTEVSIISLLWLSGPTF